MAVNWEHFVKGFLAIFRTYYGQYVADKWYSSFIKKIEQEYPEFHEIWNESEVSSAPEVLIEFRHAKAGKMLTAFLIIHFHIPFTKFRKYENQNLNQLGNLYK